MKQHACGFVIFGWLVGLSFLSTGQSAFAADPPGRAYDIAPQSVSNALKAFAAQSGMQLIYSEADVGTAQTTGVAGNLSPQDALAAILQGTGLRFELTANRVIVVQKASSQPTGNTSAKPISAAPSGAANFPAGKSAALNPDTPADLNRATAARDIAEGNKTVLEEIIVTAQKVSQKLQDVPASIAVLTGNDLAQLHATQISDWAAYVPGLNIANGSTPGQGTLILEGIAPIGAASEVGTYVNDAPIGSSTGFGIGTSYTLDLMPYDVDRIEVLRGPQGTLYGASTMGGLVKYVLKAPDPNQFSASVGGEFFGVKGADGHGDGVRGAVNLPLVADHLGLRVSGYDQYTPGYIDNGLTGAHDQNGLRQSGGHGALRWDVNSELSIQASGLYQKVTASNQTIVALSQTSGQPLYGDLTNNNIRPEPFKQQLRLYDLTLNWDLRWSQLTSASSYQNFQNRGIGDDSAALAPFGALLGVPGLEADFGNAAGVKKFTQEIRLASPQGQALKWLFGGFYTHERSNKNQVVNFYDSTGTPLSAINPFEIAALPSTYKEYAVFGDLTYPITTQFDLTGGLRYAHNSQTFVEQVDLGALGGGPQPDLPGKSSESVTTFMVSPTYHLNDKTILYVRVASGYQPGGPNIVFPSFPAPSQFDSSKLIDYQPGFKSTFLDDRASVDLAAFYIDWTKIQVILTNPTTGAPGTALVNGGKARSQGMDLSGTFSPLQGLVLGANLNYTDAKLTTAVPSLNTASGARLPYIPRWSGSLTVQYNAPLVAGWSGFAGGGYSYVGSRLSVPAGETTATGLPVGYPLGSYSAINLRTGVSHDGLTIALFAKNLADKRAFFAPAAYENNLLGMPIDIKAPLMQPRTLGVSVDKTF